MKVEIPPGTQLGGGGMPPVPPPPNEPPDDDGFGLFGDRMPEPSKKQVLQAIEILCAKYRYHNKIEEWQPFTHIQIKEVMEGIEHMIYKKEGTCPPKK